MGRKAKTYTLPDTVAGGRQTGVVPQSVPPEEQTDTISVIVPCYNIGSLVERSIRSLLAQTYRNLEILLVDDGSTDRTGEICDLYASRDDRIRVIHTENGGPGDARNAGLARVTGSFLTYLDGDDYIEPRMYEYMMGCIRQFGADMAVCRYRMVDGRQEVASADLPAGEEAVYVWDRREALFWLIAEDDRYVVQNAVWNKLCRTDLVRDLRFPLTKYEDILYVTQFMASAERVCYIDKPMHNYVTDRGDSATNTSTIDEILHIQLPSYAERDRFLESIGCHDLVLMHDYMVCKKLLVFYTAAGRDRTGSRADDHRRELEKAIRDLCRDRFDALYSTPVSDPHQRLRMRLFLLHPWFYDRFTELNEGIVLPLRRRLRAG